MKIAVMNYSGNVGKSTIARALLAPRIPAKVYAVETINSDGSDDDQVRGKEFAALHELLLVEDSAVVDVGASNIEAALTIMRQYPGWHEDYDYFVVPSAPSPKQQRDTISTIEALAEVGIKPKKIRVCMNLVDSEDDPATVFAGLLDYIADAKNATMPRGAIVHQNEVFARAKASGADVADLAADTTDHKAALAAAKDKDEKLRCAQMLGLQRLARGVTAELDAAYKALFA